MEQRKIIEKDRGTVERRIEGGNETTLKEVEGVAESLGTVAISIVFKEGFGDQSKKAGKGRKWERQQGCRNTKTQKGKKGALELGKRQLVEVVISEGNLEDIRGDYKKIKGDVDKVDSNDKNEEVVLAAQHHQVQ